MKVRLTEAEAETETATATDRETGTETETKTETDPSKVFLPLSRFDSTSRQHKGLRCARQSSVLQCKSLRQIWESQQQGLMLLRWALNKTL